MSSSIQERLNDLITEIQRNKEIESGTEIILGLQTAIRDLDRATALARAEGRTLVLDRMRDALDKQDRDIKGSVRAVVGVDEDPDDVEESDPLWIATLKLVGEQRAKALKVFHAITYPGPYSTLSLSHRPLRASSRRPRRPRRLRRRPRHQPPTTTR